MSQLDVQFFKPFVDGTLHTLKTAAGVEVKPGKPFLKGSHVQPRFDIAGVIGITSESFNGTIAICFPGPLYLSIMSTMLGETFTEITQDLQDGAAELLNMIFGHAKVVLNQQGYSIQKAIPTVIRGDNLQTTFLGGGKAFVLPFQANSHELHIEISIEQTLKS
jgi:chemotaxis protein CheX